MPGELIPIPYYIYGERRYSPDEQCRIIHGYDGRPLLQVSHSDAHAMAAAIETAQHAQSTLADVSIADVQRALCRAMDFYLETPEKRALVVALTGASIKHVRGGLDPVIAFCRDTAPLVRRALPESAALYRSTAPTMLVLPSNSEQESLFCLAQVLLARNACVVRPSSRGAAAFMAVEFMYALHRALDELGDPELDPLRTAVSVVHTDSAGYVEQLAVDGWNYIFFGDNKTADTVSRTLRELCTPRRIVVYGTGLSMTVVTGSGNLDAHLPEIADSVVINAGNECTSTDVLYVVEERCDELTSRLTEAMKPFRSGDPFDESTIGWIRKGNGDFIAGELARKGKLHCLRADESNGHVHIHATVVPLTDYDMPVEYPGPVVSVRPFRDLKHLAWLIKKDLSDNAMAHNLVTSVFTEDRNELAEILPLLHTHTIKINLPTHHFDCNDPHQGIYLLRELVDPVYLIERGASAMLSEPVTHGPSSARRASGNAGGGAAIPSPLGEAPRQLEDHSIAGSDEAHRYSRGTTYPENADYILFAREIDLLLGGIQGKVIVELCSGPGSLSKEIAKYGPEKVVGIDASKEMTDFAREHHSAPALNWRCCDVFNLHAEASDIVDADIVICQNSIHHFADDELYSFFKAGIGCLRKGGSFYLSDYRRGLLDSELLTCRLRATNELVRDDLQNTLQAALAPREIEKILDRFGDKIEYVVSLPDERGGIFDVLKSQPDYGAIIANDPHPHFLDYRLSLRVHITKLTEFGSRK